MRRALLAMVVALVAACSHTPDLPATVQGPDDPRYESASELLKAARLGGFVCSDDQPFDAYAHLSSDVARPPVDGVECLLPGGDRLYVVVYDTADQRRRGFQNGEVQLDLCTDSNRAGSSVDHLDSVVAANWRAVTPGPTSALDALDHSLGGNPEPEALSCQFRA